MDSKKAYSQLSILKRQYPHAKYYLNFSTPIELMVAAILSAQCTDEAVNACTGKLFGKYKTARDYASLKDEDIRSITFWKNKGNNIRKAAKILTEKHNGKVPSSMKDLTALPGIARKTANVILQNAFGKVEGVIVDTHVIRVAYRLGWTKETKPEKIERDLMKLFPKAEWKAIPHLLKSHGRAVCKAPLPYCSKCILNNICPRKGVGKSL